MGSLSVGEFADSILDELLLQRITTVPQFRSKPTHLGFASRGSFGKVWFLLGPHLFHHLTCLLVADFDEESEEHITLYLFCVSRP